ncbi:MAG: hypothetical protein GY810_00145 [Aureispira sp.]|nr:hypothetical protein [Aureispira sp.]
MNKYAPFIVVGVILIALISYFAYTQGPTHRWRAKYAQDGREPYDIGVFYGVLGHEFDRQDMDKRIEETLPIDSTAKGTSYMYLGFSPYYTDDEAWHLLKYVKAGGTAFLASNNVPDSVATYLIAPEECQTSANERPWTGRNYNVNSQNIAASFIHPSLEKKGYFFEYVYNQQAKSYNWSYIPNSAFCDVDPKKGAYERASLGSIHSKGNAMTNFARFRVGEGYVYIHTNPILFTNLFMIEEGGYEYANNVLAHVSTPILYWDRQSSSPPPNKHSYQIPKERQTVPKTPMEFIFAEQPLRWSWYLLLTMGFIFVLFRAKRKQRIVPVIEPNQNTSLEFVETIGRLYYQQQDHKNILKKQMQIFLAHIRQRYHLMTKDLDDRLMERIAIRAKIDKAIIKDIFDEYFRLGKALRKGRTQIKVQELNAFYLLIERFHKEVKKSKFEKEFIKA